MYGSLKEESWRIRTDKDSKAILQEADIIKCIILLRLRWCGHTETMDKEGMPRKMTTRMEGTRKGGRPLEKWTDEIEEDLKIMGIRNLHMVARGGKE
jgi:hypothetical protein